MSDSVVLFVTPQAAYCSELALFKDYRLTREHVPTAMAPMGTKGVLYVACDLGHEDFATADEAVAATAVAAGRALEYWPVDVRR